METPWATGSLEQQARHRHQAPAHRVRRQTEPLEGVRAQESRGIGFTEDHQCQFGPAVDADPGAPDVALDTSAVREDEGVAGVGGDAEALEQRCRDCRVGGAGVYERFHRFESGAGRVADLEVHTERTHGSALMLALGSAAGNVSLG